MQCADAVAVLGISWADGWRPPPSLTVSQWADAHRRLARKGSAEPGDWRTTRTPYLREIMDSLSAHDPCPEVVFMKGAQIGATEAGNNWLGYIIDIEPAPVMMVQPTTLIVERVSSQRIAPMIAETPRLRERVAAPRSRDASNTTTLKEFAGGVLVLAGANSAVQLRNMPVRFLFLDEVDAYPHDVDGEGSPVDLARKRTSTFGFRRKVFTVSTPTTKGTSAIEAAFETTDQRRYWVPCPHCTEMQVLRWSNLKWSDGHPESARYVCEHCGAEIEEHHKPAMLSGGEWRATFPERSESRRGYHLSSLYSPLGWESWASLATQWIDAQAAMKAGDAAKLKTFVNTALGETWEERGDKVDGDELRARAEDYRLRTVPSGCLLLTAGVDVQGDRLEYGIIGHGRGGESWRIDYGAIYSDPALEATWQQLDEVLRGTIRNAHGVDMRVEAAMIDSGGHHTHEVYAFARDRAYRRVMAGKGQSQYGKPVVGKPTLQDVSHRGEKIKRGVRLWPIGADTAKALLYGRMRLKEPGPGYMHFSVDLPDDYYKQITAERMQTRYVKGFPRMEWVKPAGARNEALDIEVYALAAASVIGIARWKDADWDALERRMQPAVRDLFASPAAPEASTEPAPDSPGDRPAPRPAEPADADDSPRRTRPAPRPPRRGGFTSNWKPR